MSLIATISDLIKGCPRNIRRRLLRDILLILFVTSGAILTIVLFQGIKTQRDISSTIIRKASNQVANRFQSFMDPLANISKLLQKWGESGLLKIDDPKLIATQFQALMEIQAPIHSIALADTNNTLLQLSHDGQRWLLTEFRNAEASAAYWTDYKFIQKKELPSATNDLSRATWFRGAMLNSDNSQSFFITEPYREPSTGHYVVTTSSQWSIESNSDRHYVTALSFTIEELMKYITELQITSNSHIILFEKTGTPLNGMNRKITAAKDVSAPQELTSKRALSSTLISTVGTYIATDIRQVKESISLRDGGKTWWLGLSPLLHKNGDIWVAVLIPEDDIFQDLHKQWLYLGLMLGSIFICAIIMAIFLVRRYSHQLKNLPQQHLQTLGYESELKALIRAGESSTLEFKSTMRTNLKSGKPGKEIEIAWLKTVVAFMNSDGGILLIGVDDAGAILGTEADNFTNEDKCRLHFKNMLNTHIGAEFTRFIHFKMIAIQENKIILVECERVRRPVFLSMGKQEDFFIRSGPSSMKLSMSQMVKYLAER
jgi:hypothetical protein